MSRYSKEKIFLVGIILFVVFSTKGFTQESVRAEVAPDSINQILQAFEKGAPIGNIRVYQDRRIDSLLLKHIGYNDSVGIQGWKVLIYHGRDIKKAQDAGALLTSAFPDLELNTVVDYQAPDFKTLAGAFRTREEAYKIHQVLKSEFKFSYLIPATIKINELK